uniref:Ig-like domain-containing protein n=1 Tax=Sinocyclocheilus rhinocerous TaxID=307959 RepID=A0A673K9F7_9TELE
DPIVAHVGSTVILPCWISPPENAEALEIGTVFSNPVLLYNHGKLQDVQEEPYRNRTSLALRSDQSGGLKDGDVSLRLEKLRVQDDGSFRCYVSGESAYDSREVVLKITALGSAPVLFPKPLDDGRVNISCRSRGWYPEPSVSWTSDDGRAFRPGGSSHSRGADEMFSVHSWTAVSLSDAQLVSCSVSLRTGELENMDICRYHKQSDHICLNARPVVSISFSSCDLNLMIPFQSVTLNVTSVTDELGSRLERPIHFECKLNEPTHIGI